MRRIVDRTGGRICAVLEREWEWGPGAAREALERAHCFGAASEIVHELEWLGSELRKDFHMRPIEGTVPQCRAVGV